MAETWLDDVIAPSLLQGIDINKPVPLQFIIGWEELLGEVPQVPISAPSGSANDYAGFIIQEDLDSLKKVTNLTSCFSKLLKVTSLNTAL